MPEEPEAMLTQYHASLMYITIQENDHLITKCHERSGKMTLYTELVVVMYVYIHLLCYKNITTKTLLLVQSSVVSRVGFMSCLDKSFLT